MDTSEHQKFDRNLIDCVIVNDCVSVQAMLEQGTNVNARDDEHNQTSLMFAARFPNADMVRLLLDAGAEVDAQDDWGSTALFYTTVASEVFAALLLAGADIHARDKEGNTILMQKVAESASWSEVEKLLELGVDPSIRNEAGETALDIADGLGLLNVVAGLRMS